MKRYLVAVILGVPALFINGVSMAETYPSRPVSVIVPVTPAGNVDIVARTVSEQLTTILGQTFVVNNRPGASGIVGLSYVANATPDGYTITAAPAAFIATNPSMFKSLPYDSTKDFAPIVNVATTPRILVVRASSKYKTVMDVVEDARRNPGKLNFGSAGDGTPHHLSGVLFAERADLELVHIPYKGGAPATNDLLAGHIDMMFAAVPESKPFIDAGQLRALGITSSQRAAVLPDVPTMAESGLEGMELSAWVGLLGPADMPQDAIDRINKAVNEALQGDLGKRYASMGYDSVGGSPEHFRSLIKSEVKMYADLIQAAGIKPQ